MFPENRKEAKKLLQFLNERVVPGCDYRDAVRNELEARGELAAVQLFPQDTASGSYVVDHVLDAREPAPEQLLEETPGIAIRWEVPLELANWGLTRTK